ncbi:hypothetical protein jhhlp_007020 [Lomentospora prolificans]|uniref:DNA helicase n=1 Tax=Lomentospora prolificans TaxID=41688 RepID=A0A2N3N1I8_9PEZI|nr:hypothetical protein jhhlp_007020 [Lomentospora prolificans]
MTPSASPRPATPDVGLANLDDLDVDSPLSDLPDYTFDSEFESDLDPPKVPSDAASDDDSDQEPVPADEVTPLETAGDASHNYENGTLLDPGKENHDVDDNVDMTGDERPVKRRRLFDTTPQAGPRKRAESPPWKRIEAEGPTTFTENGRRKSGRINLVPLEERLKGDKRLTRRAAQPAVSPASPRPSSNRATATPQPPSQKPAQKVPVRKYVPAKVARPTTAKQQPTREPRASSRTTQMKQSPCSPPQPTRQYTRARRTSRYGAESAASRELASPGRRRASNLRDTPARHRLRTRLEAIPILHPDQLTKRHKLFSTFDEYWARAWEIPIEEGGLLVADDDPRITDEEAVKEALIIQKIEVETEPGGLLSEDRCSVFVPEHQEEPARQWAHVDHMTKAAANFRRLLVAEHVRHKATAKKLAEACREEWRRRQPKSAEQLEQEAREHWIVRYRLVARAVFGTWENVKAEINRRRLQDWEAAEQRRVKAALNEAVTISEQKLQARKAIADSDLDSDMELDSELDSALLSDTGAEDDVSNGSESDVADDEVNDASDQEVDDDNMTSDEDEDEPESKDDGDDEHLTREQLLAKYANLPDLPQGTVESFAGEEKGEGEATVKEEDDTSDESIDMDDDLGSTDMDSDVDSDEDDDNGGNDGEEEEDESDEEAPSGLLGLFFGKSELKKLKEEAVDESIPRDSSNDKNEPGAKPVARNESSHNALPTDEPIQKAAEEPVYGSQPKVNGVDKTEDAPYVTDDDDAISLIHHPGDRRSTVEPETNPSKPATPLPDLPEMDGLPNGTGTKANGSRSALMSSRPRQKSVGFQLANGMSSSPMQMESSASERASMPPPKLIANDVEDVVMDDAPPAECARIEPAATEPARGLVAELDRPKTDWVANAGSLARTQSPGTPQPTPSGVDPSIASELVPAKNTTSRSASPSQPSAPKTDIPFLLRGTLREYQHFGLDWLAGLYANSTNGILADEMGLGKTIQTIALLAHLACYHEVWGPHLVIVPTSVMLNWEMEFKKWCPGFKILAYYGNQEERKRKRQGWNNDDVWNVCITSYQLVLQDSQVFKRRRWHYMILDEAHNIKNFKSQRWQTLLGFNTQARLLLTGTPLQNNLTELWSLLFFLMPSENGVGGFADLQEFHDWFQKPESQILESGKEKMDDEARAIISKLHKVLRPYLLRRLKADVEKQMPAKYEHVEFCRLSKRQRELYDGFLARSDTRNTLASGNYLSIINCLMQLRKVCNHPDLFVDRPIMTSFPMERSVAGGYQYTERFIRKSILAQNPMETVSLRFLNLIPTLHETLSTHTADTISRLTTPRILMDMRDAQKKRAKEGFKELDPTTVLSNIGYLEGIGRWDRFEELQHSVYLNALRRQQRPIYGENVINMLTLDLHNSPRKLRTRVPRKVLNWFEEDSVFISSMIKGVERRSAELHTTIEKFACITPAVVAKDLHRLVLGSRGVAAFQEADLKLSKATRWAPYMPKEPPVDPWHEARMRLSIQFPDKRLLQFDCGKLQTLDRLLRKLQAGGHRALIFTQMTKVLDILEQFLNIHGHKYLRLDGATKVEQRQILTDRFNNDPRILCFILSTRSGGLGINLTGADTVIFYDQDWNPAMDKQCQDRCHRIGQTRDVHIYRLVSEHTIEANILRKASQKQMLDDVVIQEGEFTTDYFNKLSVQDVIGDETGARREDADLMNDGVAAANAAMDRVLGGVDGGASDDRSVGRVLAQAEDKEDVTAARVAEKEIQADEVDFSEKSAAGGASGPATERQNTPRTATPGGGTPAPGGGDTEEEGPVELNAWGDKIHNVDHFMLSAMADMLKNTPLEIPKDKKKGKKSRGKDTRKR